MKDSSWSCTQGILFHFGAAWNISRRNWCFSISILVWRRGMLWKQISPPHPSLSHLVMPHRAVSKCKNCFASRSNQIARCSPGTHPCASPAYGCATPGARSELNTAAAHYEIHGEKVSAPLRLENSHEQVAETPSTYSQPEMSGDHSPKQSGQS